MRELYQGLYAGELDGPLLHKAMLAIWDRHFDLAYALLHDPLVLHTLNENGALRDVLLENLEHAMHAV